jgi:hypothetical protein
MASRPSLPLALAALSAVVAVTLAARAPLPQPPADSTAAQRAAAPADAAQADSTRTDSVAVDAPMVTAETAPAPAAPTPPPDSWPVDPATGMTLVNGTPVVGRVFIQHKTDHLQKMGTVAEVLAREALPADAPVTDASYTPAPREHARRFRGIMVQATLWDMDHKRTAAERRYYRPVTQAP